MCPTAFIEIRGVVFPASLIVFDSKGVDVILGFDWLQKNNGDISCPDRKITLTTPSGEELEFAVATDNPKSPQQEQVEQNT